jgi:preprotein translocase subunit YajC
MIALILIVVAFLFLYLVLVRPQKRQQRVQAEMWESLAEGDEVVTAGGIYGEVTGFDGDDVLVRIAPQLEVRVARRAIAAVVSPEAEDDERAELEADDEDGVHELAQDSVRGGGSYSEEPR